MCVLASKCPHKYKEVLMFLQRGLPGVGMDATELRFNEEKTLNPISLKFCCEELSMNRRSQEYNYQSFGKETIMATENPKHSFDLEIESGKAGGEHAQLSFSNISADLASGDKLQKLLD